MKSSTLGLAWLYGPKILKPQQKKKRERKQGEEKNGKTKGNDRTFIFC